VDEGAQQSLVEPKGKRVAAITRVTQDGKFWCSTSFAARQLHTSVPKVRELMGRGTLEWCQKRRSKALLVSLESVDLYRRSEDNPHKGQVNRSLQLPRPLQGQIGNPPKLGDRRKPQPQGFGVFAPTWDPRSGRDANGSAVETREIFRAEK
jgi:hypothetical protein